MELVMDLIQKQKDIQKESYSALEDKIKELSKGQTKEYAQAKGMLLYIRAFIKEIDEFKYKFLQEVVGKIIIQNQGYYCDILEVDYKNLHDAIAQPLTDMLLVNQIEPKAFQTLQNSKQKFKECNPTKLQKRVEEIFSHIYKLITLGGDIYHTLGANSEKLFKEQPQRVALAIWQISSNDIAVMVMSHLLSLKNIDDAEADNTGNTRQSFGHDIAQTIHQRVAWRFLRDIEELKADELRNIYREYNENDFDNIEQLSHSLWTNKLELEIGQKMIDLAIEAKIIDEYSKVNDEKGFNYLKLDKTFLEKMNDIDKKLAYSASMLYKPMVIEPIDWQGVYGGGFLPDEDITQNRFDLSLIKASSQKDKEALKGKKIPQTVLDSINHIQKTGFKINKNILMVLKDYRSDIRNFKSKNRIDFAYYRILRELLSSNRYSNSKDNIYKHFKKTKFIKLTKDKDLNKTDKSRIDKAIRSLKKVKDIEAQKLDAQLYYEIAKYKQGFDTIVKISEEMLKYQQFYFVWRMDFRGRVYPQQTLLNPQSGDLPKSLLLFANEKPLDSNGIRWFFIHGANCYGEVDKQPFEDRVEWIKSKHDDIISSAKDYRGTKFWKKAGDPFKFLAFCFEYARYIENPQTFTTGLPIAIDGSNNGFQHITALLRDISGAKSVNVLPLYQDNKLVVSDFYNDVAKELKKEIQKEIDEFENEKDKLIEKGGLFYTQKRVRKFEPSYYFKDIANILENIEPSDLKFGQFYTTYIMTKELNIGKLTQNDYEIIEKAMLKIERKMRKDEEDLEEIKFSIIDELERLYKKAKRKVDKKEIVFNKGKAYTLSKEYKLDARSLYHRFLEHGLIGRSFVKKPVMTESYGSSTAGKAKKILEDIEADGVLSDLEEDNRYIVAFQLTKVLERALESVSNSPQKYKKWMQKYAKEIGKNSKAIKWKTPLGLEIKQVEYKAKTIKVSIGKGRKVNFKVYSNDIDSSKHTKGFSPNFIHSLDATHLLMTINGLKEIGIKDIVTVHDSFATHANDIDKMSKILRRAFIELHKKEILEKLAIYFRENFDIKPKKIPYVDRGEFDLDEVLNSEYFFA